MCVSHLFCLMIDASLSHWIIRNILFCLISFGYYITIVQKMNKNTQIHVHVYACILMVDDVYTWQRHRLRMRTRYIFCQHTRRQSQIFQAPFRNKSDIVINQSLSSLCGPIFGRLIKMFAPTKGKSIFQISVWIISISHYYARGSRYKSEVAGWNYHEAVKSAILTRFTDNQTIRWWWWQTTTTNLSWKTVSDRIIYCSLFEVRISLSSGRCGYEYKNKVERFNMNCHIHAYIEISIFFDCGMRWLCCVCLSIGNYVVYIAPADCFQSPVNTLFVLFDGLKKPYYLGSWRVNRAKTKLGVITAPLCRVPLKHILYIWNVYEKNQIDFE